MIAHYLVMLLLGFQAIVALRRHNDIPLAVSIASVAFYLFMSAP